MKILAQIKIYLFNLFARQRFSKSFLMAENQRLAAAFQAVTEKNLTLNEDNLTLLAAAQEGASLKKKNLALEEVVKSMAAEYGQFVDFVVNQLKPEDFQGALPPLEIQAAKEAVVLLQKYANEPEEYSSWNEQIARILSENSQLPLVVTHQVTSKFLTYLSLFLGNDSAGLLNRDFFGKIQVADFDHWLRNFFELRSTVTATMKLPEKNEPAPPVGN